jgi:TonB family protein
MLISLNKNVEKAKKFIFWSLMLSLFFHVSFLGVVEFKRFADISKSQPKPPEKRIRIVLQSNKSKPKQIVTSEKSKDKTRDPDAKFLSKDTQKFRKQMASKNTGSFKAAGKGTKMGRKSQAKEQKVTPTTALAKIPVKAQKQKKRGKISKKKQIKFADLAVGTNAPKAKRKKKRATTSLAALGIKNGLKGKSGLSANNDFVEDLPLGDMTRLNTVEYKYYGFYHRIKQKLEQYWGNSIQKKAQALWKSGRRLPASKNRITSLEIILDTKGNIVKINVKGSSGVRELDDAAIESFNKAGPFPNPPSGMMKDGLAKIEWGFVVKS